MYKHSRTFQNIVDYSRTVYTVIRHFRNIKRMSTEMSADTSEDSFDQCFALSYHI